jgi:lipid-A-disaccharide synthase
MNSKTCLIIAGEASGDTLAAELVQALRRVTDWRFIGAGGPKMKTAGVDLSVDLTAHAVVGLWEVIKHYPELRQLFNQLIDLALRELPDVIILVDYPGFNLRYVAAIKKLVRARSGPFKNWSPKIVYYVSPQIWAWHESRVHQIARDVDLLLSIFPFEKKWYASRAPRLRVEFVGHPLVDRFASTPATHPAPSSPFDKPLILLLPGSRARELHKHVPVLAQAAQIIQRKLNARFLLIAPDAQLAETAHQLIPADGLLEIQVGGLAESLRSATFALACSGTVTMECARFGVPSIIFYKTSWATYQLGKRLVQVKYLAMANLLNDAVVYPEFIQDAATPEAIAAEALAILENPARMADVKATLARIIASLGRPGASQRAAQAVLSLFRPILLADTQVL